MKKTFPVPAMDFVVVVDGTNCNPNGDPDNENHPRQSNNGKALMSAESFRRKKRDALVRLHPDECELFMRRGAVLSSIVADAYQAVGITDKAAKREDAVRGNAELCRRHIDVRLFGAVLNKPGQGKVRGAITNHIGESVYPVRPLDPITNTRVAGSTQERSESQNGLNQEMGNRVILPHVVFKLTGSVDPAYARDVGLSELDLQWYFDAVKSCFAFSQSQTRGLMTVRKFFLFSHEEPSRNCQPATAYEAVRVTSERGKEAQSWDDYRVALGDLPKGVTVREIPVN